jgi:hypothetical protein
MSLLIVPSFKSTINSLKAVAAAVVLSALAATPVLAQAAIQEPGAFAFYYPYRDVLNGGALTPAAKLASEPPAAMQAYAARESGIGAARTQRLPAHARRWPAPSRSLPAR